MENYLVRDIAGSASRRHHRLGETAPLLFTALNNQFWSTDLNSPMANLPVVIFQFAMSPFEDWNRLAWVGALLITASVLVLSIIARMLTKRSRSGS